MFGGVIAKFVVHNLLIVYKVYKVCKVYKVENPVFYEMKKAFSLFLKSNKGIKNLFNSKWKKPFQ